MIDIKPIVNKKINCLDGSIATVAGYFNRNYEMLLSDAWRFGFEASQGKDTKCFGKSISGYTLLNFLNLKKYHGIEVKFYHGLDYKKFIKVIKSELDKGIPVGIKLDSFYCPWDKNYNILHNSGHHFLATAIEEKEMYCMDTFYEYIGTIELACFQELENRLFTFNIINKTTDVKYKTVILESLSGIDIDFTYKCLLNLADCIENYIDYKVETEGYENVWHSPLIYELGQVQSGRLRYYVFLEFFLKRFNLIGLEAILKMLELAAEEWNAVRNALVKSFMGDIFANFRGKISDRVRNIAEIEKITYFELKELCEIHNK